VKEFKVLFSLIILGAFTVPARPFVL